MSEHTRIWVLFKPLESFGTLNIIGVHCKLEDLRDIGDAFETAVKDGFPTVVFYVSFPCPEVFMPWFEQHWDVMAAPEGLEVYV